MNNLRHTINQMINESFTKPLLLDITKNPTPAPYMGKRFGQNVEPKGVYVVNNHSKLEGHLNGKAQLFNPLFIEVDDDNQIQYKRDLAQKYKAKGQRLTEKLMTLGYDSIVTVYSDGTYGEIVLFPNAKYMLS